MASSILLFFFIFQISVQLILVSPLNFCTDGGDESYYTPNSTYKTNLDHVLSNFSDITTTRFNGGFYNFSAGINPDRVSAVGLCRGDLTAGECYTCLNESIIDLTQQCTNQKEAIGWYNNCMFRFSDQPIFGVVDNRTQLIVSRDINVTTSDVDRYEEVLRSTMIKLTSVAASGGSELKFAAGKASAPDSQTIFGLVQCTPDLSMTDCKRCLDGAFSDVQVTFPLRIEVTDYLPNCYLKYANESFYNITVESTSPSTNGNGNMAPQTLVVAGLALLILFTSLF